MKPFFPAFALLLIVNAGLKAQTIDHASHSSSYKYGLVDAHDRWIIPAIYDEAAWYDFLQIGVVGNYDDAKGAVDAKGKFILPKVYKQINACKAFLSLIVAKQSAGAVRYGVLTPEGKEIIPLMYKQLRYDRISKLYRAQTFDDKTIYLDKAGQAVDYVPQPETPVATAPKSVPTKRADEEDIDNSTLLDEEIDLSL